MNTKPDSDSDDNPEQVDVKLIPEGTFGGHIDKSELVKQGKVMPEDTGDQGGGQN